MDKQKLALLASTALIIVLGLVLFFKHQTIQEQQAEIQKITNQYKNQEKATKSAENSIQELEKEKEAIARGNGMLEDAPNNAQALVTNFLKGMYESKEKNLTERYKALQPYVMEKAEESLRPNKETGEAEGETDNRISDVAVYFQAGGKENERNVVIFYTLTQSFVNPPIKSTMFMQATVKKVTGDDWKISDIPLNVGYKNTKG